MANCCEDKSGDLTAMRASHGRVLWIVLLINAAMFVVEGWAGLLAHATALLADALDMLGDALVYGFSLFVLARSVPSDVGLPATATCQAGHRCSAFRVSTVSATISCYLTSGRRCITQ
jgi:hypothetical protein